MISATISGVTSNVPFSRYGGLAAFSGDYFFNKVGSLLYFVGNPEATSTFIVFLESSLTGTGLT